MRADRPPFRVGLVQMRCSTDPDDNLRRACGDAPRGREGGAQVACLPELFRTQYFCQTEDPAPFDLAEPIPGPTTEALAAVARETGMVVVGSLFERRTAGRLPQHGRRPRRRRLARAASTARCTSPTTRSTTRSTTSPPATSASRRSRPSTRRVGTLVCWDQWYPEAARLTALQGAEILFYPTAIGWHPAEKAEFGEAQADAWETIQRAHAIANGVFVAAVNRVGHEGPADGGLEFWGGSFVADPFGRILAQAGRDREEILIVDVRPAAPGRDAAELAVPPRPPHRRLRPDHPAVPRPSHDTPLTARSDDPMTPATLGYRMPAEWEPHEATWIAWPHNREDWPGKFGPIPWVYAEIVRHLSRVETVDILVERPQTRATRGRPARPRRGRPRAASRSSRRRPTASGSATRARRSSSTRREPSRTERRRPGRLAVQRLGEVRQLPTRRPHPPAARQAARACSAGCRGSRSRASRVASCWKGARSTSTAGGRC